MFGGRGRGTPGRSPGGRGPPSGGRGGGGRGPPGQRYHHH